MSEQQVEASEQTPPEGEQQEAKTFDAEYVDKLRKEAAKYRTEAKTNSEAAKRLAAIEEASQSEVEKAAKRLADAEARVVNAEARALRRDVALEHKLSKEDADLLDALTDEDAMRRFAERLASDDKRKKTHVVPGEGKTPSAEPGDAERRAFVRQLTGRG